MHERKISRAQPGFIVFDIDDSGSMQDKLPGTSDPKYQWVERYVGIILNELLSRSTETRNGTEVVIKPRYYLSTVLYGSRVQVWGQDVMDIQAAVEKYTQSGNSIGLGGKMGGTDGAAAAEKACEILSRVVADPKFADSFPPMVFHLTDGMSQTDPRPVMGRIRQLTTADGNVLVVNAYIGTQTNLQYQGPDDFPGYVSTDDVGSNPDNLRLFEMSSVAPPVIRENLVADGIFPSFRENSRLFFDVRTKEMLKNVIQVVGSLGSRADRHIR